MKLRNGTHVDRVVDINPIAKSAMSVMVTYLMYGSEADLSSAQHNASSPLLRLPLEVKNLIYRSTFGDNLVHIIQNSDKGTATFKNTICRASISEEEAQENFDGESTHQWYAPANEGRHDCCRFQKGATFLDREEGPKVLSLSLLRCCRQIYNEAHHIPHATNTFSCNDPETLQKFVVSLAQGSNDNHLAVRSLFLEMVYETTFENSWGRAVSTGAKLLKGLQNISIDVDWCAWHFCLGPRNQAELRKEGTSWSNNVISHVLALKKLPLKTATMVISDQGTEEQHIGTTSPYWKNHEAEYRWTLDEKKEWARYAREALLEPKI
ncbi:hypothetical protein HO133_001823 [Letharia lupina]|uniref:DUF7730 domain-containing protein n=1 Tax=Letharia lupina TaxID=560253 RepID=A0A8H6FB33_9LECA|nr:uncharacterized protein HO133_001823 [Letharia lupina]KAF6221855.1 hypothetical protein HO133_001823 [Letharia lupina]